VENFAKEFLARPKFEREVFVLSSGECVTATRVVQNGHTPRSLLKRGFQRGIQKSEVSVIARNRAYENFLQGMLEGTLA
jgi:hypothetical protein